MFEGRKLVIATKHKKEMVIAPVLEEKLGVNCFVSLSFDTDVLGTFTGEIERELDPLSTARKKCLMAMEMTGCDLGIASEGSFGGHPSLYFVSADDEFLLFIDQKNHLEIIARELSTETNFNGKVIQTEKDLLEFAEKVNFPSHGIILRASKTEREHIFKGIVDKTELITVFQHLKATGPSVYAETDMRALYNPTRMKVIETATHKLVNKILSCCPQCNMPGFGITDSKKGLPCSLCGSPTNSTLSYIYQCHVCKFEKEEMYPNNKTFEEPGFCDVCNP